jgi:hypothetical protein
VPIVLKSGSLNLLGPSGPVKACNGIALHLLCYGDTIPAPSQTDSEKDEKYQFGYLSLRPESNPGRAKYGKKC